MAGLAKKSRAAKDVAKASMAKHALNSRQLKLANYFTVWWDSKESPTVGRACRCGADFFASVSGLASSLELLLPRDDSGIIATENPKYLDIQHMFTNDDYKECINMFEAVALAQHPIEYYVEIVKKRKPNVNTNKAVMKFLYSEFRREAFAYIKLYRTSVLEYAKRKSGKNAQVHLTDFVKNVLPLLEARLENVDSINQIELYKNKGGKKLLSEVMDSIFNPKTKPPKKKRPKAARKPRGKKNAEANDNDDVSQPARKRSRKSPKPRKCPHDKRAFKGQQHLKPDEKPPVKVVERPLLADALKSRNAKQITTDLKSYMMLEVTAPGRKPKAVPIPNHYTVDMCQDGLLEMVVLFVLSAVGYWFFDVSADRKHGQYTFEARKQRMEDGSEKVISDFDRLVADCNKYSIPYLVIPGKGEHFQFKDIKVAHGDSEAYKEIFTGLRFDPCKVKDAICDELYPKEFNDLLKTYEAKIKEAKVCYCDSRIRGFVDS